MFTPTIYLFVCAFVFLSLLITLLHNTFYIFLSCLYFHIFKDLFVCVYLYVELTGNLNKITCLCIYLNVRLISKSLRTLR